MTETEMQTMTATDAQVEEANKGGDMTRITNKVLAREIRGCFEIAGITENDDEEKEVDKGLSYRIPEYAKFTIKEGETLKAEASFLISQFGVIANLPARDAKIQFYPNSGAIRKVEIK